MYHNHSLRRHLNLAVCVILLGGSALFAGGCSGTPQQPDAKPSAQESVQKQKEAAFQPDELLDAYADWMPADTVAVAVGDPSALWTIFRDGFPPADRGGDTHFDAMRADMTQFFINRLGFDPTLADAAVVAGGMGWQVAILQGEFGKAFMNNEAYEAGGHTAYRFGFGKTDVWAVPLSDPAGLAFFPTKEGFAAAVAARADKSRLLAKTPKLDAYRNLLEGSDGRSIVVASHLDEGVRSMLSTQLPFPAPSAAVVSLGDDVQAELHGDAQTFDGIEALVETYYGNSGELIRQSYDARESMEAPQAGAIIYGYHLNRSYSDSLRVKRSDGVLNVNMALPRGNGMMLMGIGSAVAIPAFLKYIKRSKASEAPSILNRLERSALLYYAESGADGTCEFPPSANPLPAGEPCCDGIGPANGSKWTPPPATWEQEGWKALGSLTTEPTYFAYQMVNESTDAGTDRLILRAFADFEPGGARHTVQIHLEGHRTEQGMCEASAMPAIILNEYQ